MYMYHDYRSVAEAEGLLASWPKSASPLVHTLNNTVGTITNIVIIITTIILRAETICGEKYDYNVVLVLLVR